MKSSIASSLAIIAFCEVAFSSAPRFEAKDATRVVQEADAIFEAKPIRVQKTFRLAETSEVVSEEEIRKIERPDDGTRSVVVVTVSYVAEFEVTKAYRGIFKVGRKFEVKWRDLRGSGCPHLETGMLEGIGVWAFQEDGKRPYKPYPKEMGELVLKSLKKPNKTQHHKSDRVGDWGG